MKPIKIVYDADDGYAFLVTGRRAAPCEPADMDLTYVLVEMSPQGVRALLTAEQPLRLADALLSAARVAMGTLEEDPK